jgi:hypothetical protein
MIDVRTFIPFMVFAWHWKKDSALSPGLVHRTLPPWGMHPTVTNRTQKTKAMKETLMMI